jgi:hypothetical protein
LRTLALLIGLQAAALAAGPAAEKIVIVADSRRFTGWRAWWMNLYNESHLAFALLTIIIIPLLGLLLGTLTDFLMARLGINLKSRVLAEH